MNLQNEYERLSAEHDRMTAMRKQAEKSLAYWESREKEAYERMDEVSNIISEQTERELRAAGFYGRAA